MSHKIKVFIIDHYWFIGKTWSRINLHLPRGNTIYSLVWILDFLLIWTKVTCKKKKKSQVQVIPKEQDGLKARRSLQKRREFLTTSSHVFKGRKIYILDPNFKGITKSMKN